MKKINVVPDYPGYGNPCNGCGQCCKDQPCCVADMYNLWEKNTGCRALKFVNGLYRCGMMEEPWIYSKACRKGRKGHSKDQIKRILGSDTWCDARK